MTVSKTAGGVAKFDLREGGGALPVERPDLEPILIRVGPSNGFKWVRLPSSSAMLQRVGAMKNNDDGRPSQTMAATDMVFAGSIPEIYQRYLVPLIFETYAHDLAERLAQIRPQKVLEIAAGTGVLTRAMALRLPTQARIMATDLNRPMLDYAAQISPRDARITWRQADALLLRFGDETFDAVVCQFGAMFFPEKIQAYREAHRILKPGCHFLFNVWDQISANSFADVVTQALAKVFSGDPPLFMPRVPHGYHNVARIKEELGAAGFASIAVETLDATSKATSPLDVAIAYCQGTPLRNEIDVRSAARLEEATQAAAELLARRFGSGPIEGRIRAHVITAIARQRYRQFFFRFGSKLRARGAV